MAHFPNEQTALDKARDALTAVINREFPVGSRVVVPCGRGWMYGVVAFKTHSDRVLIRSDKGHVHHKHYGQVERAG